MPYYSDSNRLQTNLPVVPILEESDKPDFFPDVPELGGRLEALLTLGQSYCEGPLGANRKLGLTRYAQTLKLSSAYSQIQLQYFPVLRVMNFYIPWGYGWQRLREYREVCPVDNPFTPDVDESAPCRIEGEYSIDYLFGSIETAYRSDTYRIDYIAGFDLADLGQEDVVNIKSVAGMVVTYLSAIASVGLDKSRLLTNASVTGQSSVTYAQPYLLKAEHRQAITALCEPLKRYRPLPYS